MSCCCNNSTNSGPATDGTPVTPSDTEVVNFRALYIGTAGNVSVATISKNLTFTAVPAGTVLPINCNRVRATGTTATNIIGLS